MKSPQGFLLYRIYYKKNNTHDDVLVYLGRTKQPLQARIRGHVFSKPMHRTIDVHNISKIEYAELKTEADMNLYEIYFINLWKPPLNVDDKAQDDLTITLPDLTWTEFLPKNFEEWKKDIDAKDMYGWHKARNERIMDIFNYENAK